MLGSAYTLEEVAHMDPQTIDLIQLSLVISNRAAKFFGRGSEDND